MTKDTETRRHGDTETKSPLSASPRLRGSASFLLLLCLSLQAQPLATNVTIYPSPTGPYLHVEWLDIVPGHSYTLQFSADVVHWFPLAAVTNTCSTNAAYVQSTPLAGHPKCFFRMQEDAL